IDLCDTTDERGRLVSRNFRGELGMRVMRRIAAGAAIVGVAVASGGMTTTRAQAMTRAGAASTSAADLTASGVSATASAVGSGNYYVIGETDTGKTVAEGDETNNTATSSLPIFVSPPDLGIANVSFGSPIGSSQAVLNSSSIAATTSSVGAGHNFALSYQMT